MIPAVVDGPYLVEHADGVVTITFNRPEARNAIPTLAVLPLADLFARIAADPDARVVLVKAMGDHFGGGGDVAGMKASLELDRDARSKSYVQRLDNASAMVRNWCAIPQPIVTAARGSVAGAAMMYTLGADVAFGDASTYFLCAHTLIGLTPDSGLSWMLVRAIGVKRATDMFLSGRKVGAEEAMAMGLLSRIVAPEAVEAQAEKLARALARGPAQVLRDAKRMIAAAPAATLAGQLDLERDKVAEHVAAPDFEEGVTAFMEKRRARFPSAG
ncbi:MAG: enoyl-CoA hydratase/isomerase family protein [Sphingomonadales bacterium]|nr:enoyl-CoA hydratase/isomerase family protein [Sphingomonadales bacterium]